MQHGDLDKTRVLKTQRDSKSELRKPNFKNVFKSVQPIRPVGLVNPVLEQVQSTGLVWFLYQISEKFIGLVRS
jgi:hypothetical protein